MLIILQSRAMPRHFKAVRFEASRNYHAIQSYRKIMEGRFYNKCKGPFAGENRSATQEALIPPGLFQSLYKACIHNSTQSYYQISNETHRHNGRGFIAPSKTTRVGARVGLPALTCELYLCLCAANGHAGKQAPYFKNSWAPPKAHTFHA